MLNRKKHDYGKKYHHAKCQKAKLHVQQKGKKQCQKNCSRKIVQNSITKLHAKKEQKKCHAPY